MSKFDWKVLDRNYEDVIYETYNGIAKITINRPQVRNAFRPKTVMELIDAFTVAREDNEVGVIVLTGANHGKVKIKKHSALVATKVYVVTVVMLVKTMYLA